MDSLVATSTSATATVAALTIREALSGIFGFISLACWMVILVPQYINNYRTKSADGVSLAFIYLWLFGNSCSFIGGWWAGVVPTILFNAVYNCAAEIALIAQCLYYRRASKPSIEIFDEKCFEEETVVEIILAEENQETEPLLRHAQSSKLKSHKTNPFVEIVVVTVAMVAIGIAFWVTMYKFRLWEPTPVLINTTVQIGPQLFGYLSAITCLSARIPQIAMNHRKKSCEGLSILFFVLSVLGNITYAISIICHSTQPQYLTKSMSWLLASIGAITEDFVILAQFYYYRPKNVAGGSESVI